MAMDLTAADAFIKDVYTKEEIENLAMRDRPALALISKKEEFGGEKFIVPVVSGNNQSIGASFAQAQALAGTTSAITKKFEVARAKYYGVAVVDGETLQATKGNTNAFTEALELQIDTTIDAMADSMWTHMFGTGYGVMGEIAASGVSSATVTLATLTDADNFNVGDEIVFADSISGDALRDSGDYLTVQSVDRVGGTVTFTTNVSNVSGATSGDFMFRRSDRQDSATPSRLVITGFEGWIPTSAPSSTAFFGLDRTSDPVRLAGVRYDASGKPIDEALIDGLTKAFQLNARPTHVFINPTKFGDLVKVLGAKAVYDPIKVNQQIGFDSLKLHVGHGVVNVVPDPRCPLNRAYGLRKDDWCLKSLGELIHTIEDDGKRLQRQASADGVEVRFRSMANLVCKAPGKSVNIKLA
jgi:hypothetical protein